MRRVPAGSCVITIVGILYPLTYPQRLYHSLC